MPKLTPQQAREKHANRLKAATNDIRVGVGNVTVAPGVKAAAKVDKLKQNWLASVDNGTWAKRVSDVPLDQWKASIIEKGIPRIAQGVDSAADKIEDFYSQLFPYQERLQSETAKLPDLTLEDNINRMTTFVRGMSKFRRK